MKCHDCTAILDLDQPTYCKNCFSGEFAAGQKRGQEEMRERAAQLIYRRISDREEWFQSIESPRQAREVAELIRALPVSEEKP